MRTSRMLRGEERKKEWVKVIEWWEDHDDDDEDNWSKEWKEKWQRLS